MSSSVESRIVSMKFDNRDFERGVSTTLRSLGTLGKALDAGFTSKAVGGLSRMTSAVKNFSFGNMGGAVDGISGKFVALSTVAVTALATITNKAIHAGAAFVKQFTGFEGMMSGFREYELNINSIQTIIANTGAKLPVVTGYLEELNEYADKTVYNFAQMAENIGRFTAAGVELRPATDAIKGMANTAALTGANTQQLSSAMYQMSQALSTGVIKLMDWNSLNNANMGTENVRNALMATTRSFGDHGKAMDEAMTKYGSFRDSLQAGWLTAEVFTKTMKVMGGQTIQTNKDVADLGMTMGEFKKAGLELGDTVAFSVEQLKEMGYSQEAAEDLHRLSQAAIDSAQDIKTFTQLISVAKETIGSGWAKTWAIVIGDFDEAKKLFTSMGDVINGFFERQADARNKMLTDWKKAGGRDALLGGLENLWRVAMKIIRPIRNAFRDVFPRTTGEQLAKITKAFEKFTEGLLFGAKHSKNIREIFQGIFTIFRVGIGIIGGLIRYVAEFFGIIIGGGGGDALGAILGLVSEFANGVTWLGRWLEKGDKLEHFFDALIEARNSVLEPLVGAIGAVVEALVALVSGDVSGFFSHLGDAGNSLLSLFGVVGDKIVEFIGNIAEYSQSVSDFLSDLGSGGFDAIASIFENIGAAIDNVKEKLNFGGGVNVEAGGLSAVGEGLNELSWIATAFGAVWRTLGTVFSFVGDTIAKAAPRLWRTFGIVGDKFLTFIETMDMQDLLAIINTGVFVLMYNAFRQLAKGLTGIVGVGESASGAFDQLTGTLKSMQTAVQAQLIMSIAIAVALLAASLIALSFVPADKLKSSGAAIAGMITGLVAAMKLLGAGGGKSEIAGEVVGEDLQLNLLSVAAAMIGMATAIFILAGAMKVLESTSWESFGKMAAVMGLVVTAMIALGAAGPVAAGAGAAIFMMSAGMVVLAGALKLFEAVDWESIGKMAVILTTLAVALAAVGNPVIGPLVLAGAAAMFIMAPALTAITIALLGMQLIKWESIGKLAVVLTALALGVTGMIAALPGAFAIGVLAAGLTLLLPVLQALGAMDLGTFAKSLGLLVITLLTLGGVSAILGVLSPMILAFGIALTAVGVALVLVGTGTLAFATGLGILAASGAAAFTVLLAGVTSFLAILPQWILQFKATLDAIIYVLRETGPPFVRVMAMLMRKLAQEVVKSLPDLRRAGTQLIEALLKVIRDTSDDFVKTGIKLILDFLDGLDKNMKKLTDKGAAVIVKFLEGIQRNDDKIAREGRQTVESLIRAMGRELINLQGGLIADFLGLGRDLVQGIAAGIGSFASSVGTAALNAVQGAWNDAMNWLRAKSPSRRFMQMGKYIDQGLAIGIDDNAGMVGNSASNVARMAYNALNDTMSNLSPELLTDMSFDPTIRPVLDLSEVEAGAGRITGLLTPAGINAGVSLAEAQVLADELLGRNGQNGGDSGGESSKEVNFTQNLYSPKAINAGEHYRQTKNLLSIRLKELGL